MGTAGSLKQTADRDQRAPRDPADSFLTAAGTTARALLIVVGAIGMTAVLLLATADGSVIRAIGDRVANAPAAHHAP